MLILKLTTDPSTEPGERLARFLYSALRREPIRRFGHQADAAESKDRCNDVVGGNVSPG